MCACICAGVYAGEYECACICMVYACVWFEFSEFLPENRVLTSADFNTYPIRIFSISLTHRNQKKMALASQFFWITIIAKQKN